MTWEDIQDILGREKVHSHSFVCEFTYVHMSTDFLVGVTSYAFLCDLPFPLCVLGVGTGRHPSLFLTVSDYSWFDFIIVYLIISILMRV